MLEIRNFTTNKIDEKFLQKVAKAALEVINREKAFPKLKDKSKIEISLAIVGNARMRKLNKMYRGKNRVTDVLSFGDKSVFEYLGVKEFVEAPDGVSRMGEIIICHPQAKKQAKKISDLLIHGILHLFGYSHEEMQEVEKKILICLKKT